jgi:hypothetical protein
MKKLKSIAVASLLTLATTQMAYAEQTSALAFSIGAFDALDDDTAAEVGLEYRFSPVESLYNIIPAVGISANSDGGYWVHSGIRYDIDLSDNWVLTPHFAASLYENGGGKDLGYGLEFRSGIEIAYKLNESSHIGLSIYHLSNASIKEKNPGEESIILSYSFASDFF